MDLLDLAEVPEELPKAPSGNRLLAVYPTMCVEPQKAQRLGVALEQRDWRACNGLHAVWFDWYAERWFPFTKHFWDHMEYLEVSSG